MSLYSELRRRNVFKVAALYVVAGWLVLQVAEAAIDLVGLPAGTARFVLLLLVIAFPVALIFSWVYEITPAGLKKEIDVDQTQSIVYKTGQKLNAAVAVLLVLGIAGLIGGRLLPDSPEMPGELPPPELSVAVMPFENLSPDGNDDYFAEGVSSELVDLLSAAPGLHVSARASSFSFGNDLPVRADVGRALGVAHLLEGSVRREANRVRISARLVDTADNEELWSDTFDRDIDGVFSVMNDIVAAVLDQLEVDLGAVDAPSVAPIDRDAYDFYLQALALGFSREANTLTDQVELAKKAADLEPGFGPAWLLYGYARYTYAMLFAHADPQMIDDAHTAFLRAAALGESRALAFLGLTVLASERDAQKAANYFDIANDLDSNDWLLMLLNSGFCAQLGYYDAALGYAESARRLDPLSGDSDLYLVRALVAAGRHDDADAALARVRSRRGAESEAWLGGIIALNLGDTDRAFAEFLSVDSAARRDAGAARAYFRLGEQEDADAALRSLLKLDLEGSEHLVAAVYAERGNADLAFEWLIRAHEAGNPHILELESLRQHGLAPLVIDPRWPVLLSTVGLDRQTLFAPVCNP